MESLLKQTGLLGQASFVPRKFLKSKESKTKEGEAENAAAGEETHSSPVFTLFSFHLKHLGSFINKLRLSCPTRFSVKNPDVPQENRNVTATAVRQQVLE